jgi:hypothetical protein
MHEILSTQCDKKESLKKRMDDEFTTIGTPTQVSKTYD